MPNRLADSSSPYLRQHADNPVNWREWDAEVWEQAEQEQKPVFLSIGYSSCHWCHVMAHESFESDEVAESLNRHFLCVKLDREQRPDVDDIYMTAVQLATGHGGWPMSIFLTPGKKPFFAGTYFPLNGRQGVPGFLQIVNQLGSAWRDQKDEVLQAAEEFSQGLEQVLERTIAPVTGQIEVSMLDQAIQSFHQEFDYEHGGMGVRPKFPPHSAIEFWLNYAARRDGMPGDTGSIDALVSDAGHMALLSLEQMALGGLHDHVGGGFHRYSTDEKWLLPHFEKMLYDNAQLLSNYATASRACESEQLRILLDGAAAGIVRFVEREMTSPEGLFYCALDADSEGEEGAYYVWHWDELLANELDESLWLTYRASPDGNFNDEATGQPSGKNILHLAEKQQRDSRLDSLMEVRENREKPGLDDKAILAWNGLMIGALAKAGKQEIAEKCASIWLKHDVNTLPHEISGGKARGLGFLDDYAFFADGLLDLYDATERPEWLDAAQKLADAMIELFGDPRGGFTYTSDRHEKLFGKTQPSMDSSTPSPNGVAVRVLRRLGRNQEALIHLTSIYGWAQRLPSASSTILGECLNQLLLAGDSPSLAGKAGVEFIAYLSDTEVVAGADKSASTTLIVEVPEGCHVYSNDPNAKWNTPTTVTVDGVYAEAGFPDSSDGMLKGKIEIPLRLHPKGGTTDFEVVVTAQVCTESECFAPSTVTIPGRLIVTDPEPSKRTIAE